MNFKSLLIIIVLAIFSTHVYAQDPHDLLNSWNSNTENGTTYPGCEQWKITFPTGDEEKDLCNDVANNRQEFYYVNNSDGLVFKAPIRSDNGTTPNSGNVRSELREREIDGGSDVYWTTDGNHVIYVKQAITHLPINKDEVVATQIHGDKSAGIDDAMVVRLEGSHLFLAFNYGTSSQLRDPVTIKSNYSLGTVHEVIFQVIDGKHYCYYSENGNLKNAFANGNANSYLVTDNGNPILMDLDYEDAYFKAGCYAQSNANEEGNDTDNPNNYGEVVIYDLVVDHNGTIEPGGGTGNPPTDGCTADVPGSRTVSNIGETTATVSWNFNDSFNHYNVRYATEGSGNWTTFTSLRESEGDFTVTNGKAYYNLSGLSSNTDYQWQVRAKCDDNAVATSYAEGQGQDFSTSSGNNGGGGDNGLYEAESANITAGVIKSNGSASNDSYVDGSSGFNLEFDVSEQGNVDLTFRIKVPSQTRSMGVFVNGIKIGSISTASNNWTDKTISATLGSGGNAVELRDTEGTWEFDVDYLEVSGGSDGGGNPPSGGTFNPDPNKIYYIDSPHHNLRLAADGESEDPYTTSTNTSNSDVKWRFVSKGNGSWHIRRAAGGSKAGLRTRNNGGEADMQPTSYSGTWTYYDITASNAINNTYFLTLPDGPGSLTRMQVNSSGDVKFVSSNSSGTWESFRFTEADNDNNSGSGSTVNLALNGNASQSTTAHGGVPSRAIDGNTNGNWSNGSVTHTNASDSNDWWEVDLGNTYTIDEIVVWNRTNCCSGRLGNFTVQILNSGGSVVWSSTVTSAPSPDVSLNTGGVNGETVRIEQNLTGSNPLSLAEVQVFGDSTPKAMITSNDNDEPKLKIYPNPFNSEFTIELLNTREMTISKVLVVDQYGTIVYEENKITTEKITAQAHSYKPGIYFVLLYDNNGVLVLSDKVLKK